MASNVTTTPRELASDTVTSMSAIASTRGPAKNYGTGDIAVRALEGINMDFAIVGVRAALWPASRAARLPVLTAVASD